MALGLGPLGIDVCWRILSGMSIAATWYLLVRHFVRKPWIATALSAILLVDCGLLGAGIGFRQVQAFARLLAGSPNLIRGDLLHRQWRVAAPALTMAYLLLHLWLVTRSRQISSRLWVVLSGISFGLLFHVYPYYWTAATVALALAFLIDHGHRRVYACTALIGVPLGALRLYWDWMLKQSTSPDWLVRSDKLVAVSRYVDLKPPFVAGLILVLSLIWIWRRRRDAIYLWTMALAGYVLFKSHIVTGYNIENYHWFYVWGPCCSLLLLLLLVDLLPGHGSKARAAFITVVGLAAVSVVMGVSLRVAESLKAPAGLLLVEKCANYQAQRIDSGRVPLVSGSTAAGDDHFACVATILENLHPLDNYWVFLSPQVTDQEWYDRTALNGYLLGQDRASFAASASARFLITSSTGWGPWTRDARDGEGRHRAVLSAYDAVASDVGAALDRFRVRYVGLPARQDPPGYLVKGGWVHLENGPFWQVWERITPLESTAPASARTR
jgi:hypothetical protein